MNVLRILAIISGISFLLALPVFSSGLTGYYYVPFSVFLATTILFILTQTALSAGFLYIGNKEKSVNVVIASGVRLVIFLLSGLTFLMQLAVLPSIAAAEISIAGVQGIIMVLFGIALLSLKSKSYLFVLVGGGNILLGLNDILGVLLGTNILAHGFFSGFYDTIWPLNIVLFIIEIVVLFILSTRYE